MGQVEGHGLTERDAVEDLERQMVLRGHQYWATRDGRSLFTMWMHRRYELVTGRDALGWYARFA